jgi:phosphoenolpyruvate synthase/pyruvate phosphate dikinase
VLAAYGNARGFPGNLRYGIPAMTDGNGVDTQSVVWIEDDACTDPQLVGNKCATLAKLRARGFNVPNGFCITTAVLPLGAEIYGPAVRKALRRLQAPWAARSSSTAEDSRSLAFPGLFCTELGLTDVRSLLEAIRDIDISAKSTPVKEYAQHHGVDPASIKMAILVQGLVSATAAGVSFSRDPVTGADCVVIEANYGLGETVVDGSVTPDSITVSPKMEIVERIIGSKEQKVANTTREARVRRVPTSALERSASVLSDEAALEVARLTVDLEREIGVPVDVEWAFVEDELYLLQARPITTVANGLA